MPSPEHEDPPLRREENTSEASKRGSKQTSPVNAEPPNLFHQITADFLTFESRSRNFLKSLLPNSTTPRNDEFASDESAVSNESQNLQGFEGCLAESDGGHYHGRGTDDEDDDDDDDDSLYSDERDGEDCSSSNSSGVYNYEYRDRRLRQILGGSMTGGTVSDRDSTDGTPSAHRSRNGSVEPRQSASGRQRTRSSGSRAGGGVAQPHSTNSGPLTQEQIPWDLREQLSKLDVRLSAEKDRFSSMDVSRRCAVLRVAKGSLQRAYELCEKYSQLIDRFALQMITVGDVQQVLSRNCFVYIGGDPKLCKDGRSAVLWICASRLPPIPKEDKKTFQKQEYCTALLRALLFLLETHRFGGATAKHSLNKRNRGRSVNSNQSDPATTTNGRASATTPREKSEERQGGETPQIKPPPVARSKGLIDPPSVVVLVDVSNTESARLSALVQVLSSAADLFRSSYPIKIRSVVISPRDSTQFGMQGEGQTSQHHEDPEATPLGPQSAAVAPPTQSSPETTTKKPFAFVSSLFGNKKLLPSSRASQSSVDQAKSGPKQKENSSESTTNTSSTSNNNNNSNNVGSRLWLNVMVSTWKLRFLPPTVRARTMIADFSTVVDAVRLTRLLLTSTRQLDQPQHQGTPEVAVAVPTGRNP